MDKIVPLLRASGRFAVSRVSDLVVLHTLQSLQQPAEGPVQACSCDCRDAYSPPPPPERASFSAREVAILLWSVVLIFFLGLALGWRAGRSSREEPWILPPDPVRGPPAAAELPALVAPPLVTPEARALEAEAHQQLQRIRARHGPGR